MILLEYIQICNLSKMSQIIVNDSNQIYSVEQTANNKYNNVLSYKYSHCKSEITLRVDKTINPNIANTDVYYIFDCPGEDALVHWIIECFMFYPLFLEIKKIYPNIRILTTNNKKYVKNMFMFFGIDNEIVNTIQNMPNICFFSPIISLNDLQPTKINYFNKYLINYIHDIKSRISGYNINSINVLCLPRNTKDNYAPNDHTVPGIDDIENNIINIGGVVLNTYQINNINLQYTIVNNSKNIIVEYGSSLYFNCLFVSDKNIIVLNNYGLSHHHDNFIGMKVMYDLICSQNKVNLISPKNSDHKITYSDIKDFIV